MDGVLTDGNLLVTNEGDWLRQMNVRDGYALQAAVKAGYRVIVISGSNSSAVKSRLQRLGVTDVFMGITDKHALLLRLAADSAMLLDETLFMGDDVPDYEGMAACGLPACPADAAEEIRGIATYISHCNGGAGCVRDVIEKVMKLNGQWNLHTTTPST